MRSFAFLAKFLAHINSDEYCTAPDLTQEEQDNCVAFAELFIPRAFRALERSPTDEMCNLMYNECQDVIICKYALKNPLV